MAKKKKIVDVDSWTKWSRFPVVRLLAYVMDPKEEEEDVDILMGICDKYELKYEDDPSFIYALSNTMGMKWDELKLVKEFSKEVFDIPLMGSVRMTKDYMMFYYDKGQTRYQVEFHATAILRVNNKLIESRVWEDTKISAVEGEIRTMFEKYDNAACLTDYFFMVEAVFKKGRMDIELFRESSCKIVERVHDVSQQEDHYPEECSKAAKFIFDRYMTYLWGEEDTDKPLKYRLGLDSFIIKNLPHWLNGEDGFELQCNLYTDEHKLIKKIFSAKEQDAEYLHKVPSFLNLEVWNGWTKSSPSFIDCAE